MNNELGILTLDDVIKDTFNKKEFHTWCFSYIQDDEIRETCYRSAEAKAAIDWFYKVMEGKCAQLIEMYEANLVEAAEDFTKENFDVLQELKDS